MLKRLLITGATGLVGQRIVQYCHQKNISVHYLTTDTSKIQNQPNYKGYYWNIGTAYVDKDCFEGVDAIFHLAGCSIAKPWNKRYKKAILESRTDSLNLLFTTLQNLQNHSIRQIISASGISIYPHSFSSISQENTEQMDASFLSMVVREWEKALWQFEQLHITTTAIRTGVVIAPKQGILQKMERPIKMGIGAILSKGQQYISWIHVDDLARMYLFLCHKKLKGIYNGVAPNPTTNRMLTKVIARKLHKKIYLPPVPAFMLRWFFGERADLLLKSHRISSKKTQDSGFIFAYPTIELALAEIYSKEK